MPSTEIVLFFSLALRGACPSHFVLLLLLYIYFYYALPSFHTGPWFTAHFVKIDIECQTPQAPEKSCLYLGTCEPSVEVVVANVSVKGI